jgi:hypothetical protein
MSEPGSGRVRRAEWARRVQGWQESGQTAEQYGAQIGVKARTLTYWKWLLRKEAQGEPRAWPRKQKERALTGNAAPEFVEIRAGSADARFALELRDGRRLLVPDSFDTDGLRRLLAVLEGK